MLYPIFRGRTSWNSSGVFLAAGNGDLGKWAAESNEKRYLVQQCYFEEGTGLRRLVKRDKNSTINAAL